MYNGGQGEAEEEGGGSHEARTGREGGGGDGARGGGVSGAGDFGAAKENFLGNPHGADDADEDFLDDGGQENDNDSGGADNLDDGASGSSGGSGEIAPGGRTRPSGGGATVRASPVSSTGHDRGEASGQSRRAAVADAEVEALLPGGGDLMGSLAA